MVEIEVLSMAGLENPYSANTLVWETKLKQECYYLILNLC